MPDKACKRCGACCTDMGSPPFLSSENARLPWTVRAIRAAMYRTDPNRSEKSIPCYFWDDVMGCRIYPHRPGVCRDFAPGGEGCAQHPDGRR